MLPIAGAKGARDNLFSGQHLCVWRGLALKFCASVCIISPYIPAL